MGNLNNKSKNKDIIMNIDSFFNLFQEKINTDDNALLQFYIINNFYEQVESALSDNSESNAKSLAKQISNFCFSEKFFIYLVGELKDKVTKQPLDDLIVLFEKKNNFLSLRILFYLLEEIKTEQFEKQIREIIRQYKMEPKNLETTYDIYFQKHRDNFMEFRNNPEKAKKSKFANLLCFYMTQNYEENTKHISFLWLLDCFLAVFVFYDIFKEAYETENKPTKNHMKIYETFSKLNVDKEEIYNTINILLQQNSLNHTECPRQLFLFNFSLIKFENRISLRGEIDKKFFESYGYLKLTEGKLVWTLYEEDPNNSDSSKKYIAMILEGKKTEKEKYNFDVFDNIIKIKIKEKLEGITGSIFESILYNKTILLIKIDCENKNKTTLEQFLKEIKLFQESCPIGYNNLDTYIQIENKVINLDASHNLLVQELIDKNIIDENIKINIEKNKICINENENNNAEFNRIKFELAREKEKNKLLEEKIKKLERELNEQKNKNNQSAEMLNIELKKQLDNEIKKFNDFKKQVEEDKVAKMYLGNETKESMMETIIEKDRENKELKSKISRLPFTLEEGEYLMIITFITTDQHLHYSIICKNTDEFHKIEGELYKKYPEYSENENYFIVNGDKINKYKTLEQNKIKNNSVIMLSQIT